MILLTDDKLRRIVFECSVTYANALLEGRSVQEAEWARDAKLREVRARE